MCDEAPKEEWIVRMPLRAWQAARELEENCRRCGLDSYDQAQVLLGAASYAEEAALWASVWEYVQAREAAGKDDRFLVLLET